MSEPVGKTVAEAAAGGDELELLVAMRDRIAQAVSDPECPKRDRRPPLGAGVSTAA